MRNKWLKVLKEGMMILKPTNNMKKIGQNQLKQVISNILVLNELWQRILSPKPAVGELEEIDQDTLKYILNMNQYVPHVNLMDEMFAFYQLIIGAGAENLVASALTLQICKTLQSGKKVKLIDRGDLLLPTPYIRVVFQKTSERKKKQKNQHC